MLIKKYFFKKPIYTFTLFFSEKIDFLKIVIIGADATVFQEVKKSCESFLKLMGISLLF